MKRTSNLFHCRRGGVALMFAVAAIPTIAFAALGTEAGSWYLIRRHAQNAADAAALAGALQYTINSATYKAAGAKLASDNGFVNADPQQVALTDSTANGFTHITAVVGQTQPTLFTSTWLGPSVLIKATAVAEIQSKTNPCAWALHGLTIGGSQTFSGGNCSLLSNAGVKYNSDATFTGSGWGVDAVTGCGPQHCDPANVTYNYQSAPATPPIALQPGHLPSTSFSSGTQNINCPANGNQFCPSSGLSPGAYGDLKISNNGSLNLLGGTYIFHSITMTGGNLTGINSTGQYVGVNIVIAAATNGLKVTGGTIRLEAASTNSTYSDLSGVLIYDNEVGSVNVNGASSGGVNNSIFGGAWYFPSADVTWNGNTAGTLAGGTNGCTEIIGSTLTFQGNANLDISGCKTNTLPTVKFILLVQ